MARKVKKASESATLLSSVEQVFLERGVLSSAVPGFIARSSQQIMAAAIVKAIQERSVLLVEAGTGTGKTFAYLVPALLSGQKVLISTATKTLQDQLVQRDLPVLMRALGIGAKVQNLKGRSNYLCDYRARLFMEEGRTIHPETLSTLINVYDKFPQLQEGVREELPEVPETDPVWPYVTSTTENCLGSECPQIQNCFLMKARNRAMESDLVVVNHHLFFADARLKEDGFGALLAGMQVLIFDEAHQLSEIASDFYGTRLSTWMLSDFLADLLREFPKLSADHAALQQETIRIEERLRALRETCPEMGRFLLQDQLKIAAFRQVWEEWGEVLQGLKQIIENSSYLSQRDEYPGVSRCFIRLQQIQALFAQFQTTDQRQILWVEVLKHHLVFYANPVDIAPLFQKSLAQYIASIVCTSATLTVAGSFDNLVQALGFQSPATLLLPSPFDYQTQAFSLYIHPFPKGRSA